MIKASPPLIFDEEHSPYLSKLLYLMADVNAFILLRVNQELNTFVEGMPGKVSSLAKHSGPI